MTDQKFKIGILILGFLFLIAYFQKDKYLAVEGYILNKNTGKLYKASGNYYLDPISNSKKKGE